MRKQISFKGMRMTSVLSLEGLKLAFEEQLDELVTTTAQTTILEREIKRAGLQFQWADDHDRNGGFIVYQYIVYWEPEIKAFLVCDAGGLGIGMDKVAADVVKFIAEMEKGDQKCESF